jgi:rubrerythrin
MLGKPETMNFKQHLEARRHRGVWRDPVRRYRTLQSFSETEEDGGKDLVTAAKRVLDADLRMHLLRHADDERRHAEMFRRRAAEVRDLAADNAAPGGDVSERAYDLSGARPGLELDAHGFFNAGLCEELGEVAYVAMLHIAEKRAATVFEMHSSLNDHDPETKAVFDEILKDEKYHISYTGVFLDKWRAQGREREVDEGLSAAKSSRFLGAWKRLGVRSAGSFSRAVLFVMYWTVLAPFGLLSGRRKAAFDWQAPLEPVSKGGQSQY